MGFTLVQKYLHVRKTRPAIVIIKSSRIELLERNGKLLRLTALFNFECGPNGKKNTPLCNCGIAKQTRHTKIIRIDAIHSAKIRKTAHRGIIIKMAHTHTRSRGGFSAIQKSFETPGWLLCGKALSASGAVTVT